MRASPQGVDSIALLNAPAPLEETLTTGDFGLGDSLVDDSRLVIGDVTIDVVDATLTVDDYFAFA